MASKRRLRRKSCDGKIRYDDFQNALNKKKEIFKQTKEQLHIYGCKFCGGYHLGHATAAQKKRTHIYHPKTSR